MDRKKKSDEKEELLKEKELNDVTGGKAPHGGWKCYACGTLFKTGVQPEVCTKCGRSDKIFHY